LSFGSTFFDIEDPAAPGTGQKFAELLATLTANLLTCYGHTTPVHDFRDLVSDTTLTLAKHAWVGRRLMIEQLISAPGIRQNVAGRTKLIKMLVMTEAIDQDL